MTSRRRTLGLLFSTPPAWRKKICPGSPFRFRAGRQSFPRKRYYLLTVVQHISTLIGRTQPSCHLLFPSSSMSPSADSSPRLGAKRSRSASPSESADEGPLPPPPASEQQAIAGAAEDDSDDDDVGPMPPPPPPAASTSSAQGPSSKRLKAAKQQQQQPPPPTSRNLPHESLYLAALPSASRYHQSFMHRAPINFSTVSPHTNFLITTSVDGHIKFWKKQEVGIEFVKHYRAHLGVVTAVSVSADGAMFATGGSDKSLKIFDVVNFGESQVSREHVELSRVLTTASRCRFNQHDQGRLRAESHLLDPSQGQSRGSVGSVSE